MFWHCFLADYNEQLNQILKDLSYFEPDPNGYIEEAFIQNSVIPALKKLENAIGYLLEDAKAAIQEVADEDIDPICTCKTLGRGVANG